jgi:hypothetical protein
MQIPVRSSSMLQVNCPILHDIGPNITNLEKETIPEQGSCDSLLLQVVPLKMLFYA